MTRRSAAVRGSARPHSYTDAPDAADAGGGRVHAEAGDDLLRGAQEPQAVRPAVGLKNHPLTTCPLVRLPAPRSRKRRPSEHYSEQPPEDAHSNAREPGQDHEVGGA